MTEEKKVIKIRYDDMILDPALYVQNALCQSGFEIRTISIPSRFKDVFLGMRPVNPMHRVLLANIRVQSAIDNYWQVSEAKVRSRKFVTRCASSPWALPVAHRDACSRHYRWGRTRLRADVNYYWQFHETNSLLALLSVHTRCDAARYGTTDSDA